MTNRTLFSILCAMILFTAFYTGCSKSRSPLSPEQLEENWKQANPASPTPTFSPTPGFTIWKNGQLGSFVGENVSHGTLSDQQGTINVRDNVSDDTTVLAAGDSSNNTTSIYFETPHFRNASQYYANGHICFNLRMLTDTAKVTVEYVKDAFNIAVYEINNVAASSDFQHYCIPLTSFSSNQTDSISGCFQLYITDNTSRTNPAFYINDIRWTID